MYEVRKLTEYVIELDRLPPVDKWIEQGHGAVGQALLEATLIHIRNLGVFLRPGPTGEQDAHATHYAKWSTDSFLDGPGYGRLTAKVAHLNHSRLEVKARRLAADRGSVSCTRVLGAEDCRSSSTSSFLSGWTHSPSHAITSSNSSRRTSRAHSTARARAVPTPVPTSGPKRCRFAGMSESRMGLSPVHLANPAKPCYRGVLRLVEPKPRLPDLCSCVSRGTGKARLVHTPVHTSEAARTRPAGPLAGAVPSTRSSTPARVYAVVDLGLSPDFPLGDALDVFIRREDAARFVEEVRRDAPEESETLRIEERELEAGGLN